MLPGPFPAGRPCHFAGEFQERIGFYCLLDVLFQFQGSQLEQFHLLDQMEIQLLLHLGSQSQFGNAHNERGPPFFHSFYIKKSHSL